MLVSRVLNLFALMFTTVFSAFLLLVFKWHALNDPCIIADTCDIWEVCPILGKGFGFCTTCQGGRKGQSDIPAQKGALMYMWSGDFVCILGLSHGAAGNLANSLFPD
jgi:hypothetical protein